MNSNKLILVCFGALLLTGCSILPYHNDYACKLEGGGYGKCINSDDAYDEAVTGNNKGHEINEDGVSDDPKESAAEPKKTASTQSTGISTSYKQYRDRVYDQTAELIKKPQTPVVRQPSVVRTLILSYSPSLDEQVAYMPRYVFSILNGPKFTLSDYQLNSEDATPAFLMGGKG